MAKIIEGDKDLVAQMMADVCNKVAALVDGNFLDSFEIRFEIDGEEYLMTLEKLKP